MCLWLLTACLGLLPGNPSTAPIVVVPGVPAPILQPTTTITTTTTTVGPPPPGNMTGAPPGNMTGPPPANMTGPPPGNMTGPPPGSMGPPPTGQNPTGTPPASSPSPMGNYTTSPITTMPSSVSFKTPNTSPANDITNLTPTPSTLGGGLISVIPCDNPDVVCLSNPDETTTGPPMIDPRLGTTPSTSGAYQFPPINGYRAQIPSHDTAVIFPRQKRSFLEYTKAKDFITRVKAFTERRHVVNKRQSCSCVPAGTCASNFGAGLIDIRIVTPGGGQCSAGQVYCCGDSDGQTTIQCGTRQSVPLTAISPGPGQAKFGDYPWQAIILTKQNDYIAGGVLIDQQNVLTVTHRLVPYVVSGTAPNVKVRLGEWDAAGTYEPVPYQEYIVQKVFSHPSYVASTLQYDITVLRLASEVPLTPTAGSAPTINKACLPPSPSTTYTGQRCWVSGWGKDMFGVQGQYQQILKEVEVPIVDSSTCQGQLRAARLGPNYVLDTTSFICAGGEANKDACTGDGGSGLVCQIKGQWVVVGLVSWGLGCATPNVPAAYVNVAALLPWIQQQLSTP